MKKLFLASEAKNPESMDKLEKFVGGFRNKTIAYIPTAANGEESYGRWKNGGSWKVVNSIGAKVQAVVLEEVRDENGIELLENKDIIWFAGGFCGYLMYWIRRRQIDIHLDRILESGAVYVGSSAGSMVCAKSLDIAEVYLGEKEHGASIIPGLGLIDFDIYPHYEDDLFAEIKDVWKGGDLYLLKNGEAITIEGEKVEILGEKRVLRSGELISD